MAEMDQLTKEMNREVENDQVFLADTPPSPDSDRRLCRRGSFSYTCATQRDAHSTGRDIGAVADLHACAAHGHTQADCNGHQAASDGQRRRGDRLCL